MENVPFDLQIWSAGQVAAYLGVDKRHFMQAVRYSEGFPKDLDLPYYVHGGRRRKMYPRWAARDIAAFMLSRRVADK